MTHSSYKNQQYTSNLLCKPSTNLRGC